MNKKFLFISIVLIVLCSLSAVSANETCDVLSTSDEDVLSADSTENFTKLSEDIANNNVVNLESDVALDSEEASSFTGGIAINNNVTINGNNHIINGTGLVRIFNIGNSSNVVLKDLIITGGYVTSGHGGAIYLATGNLTVENCTFINNTLKNNGAHGGAIHAAARTTLTIKDSVFENNVNTPTSSAQWWGATTQYGGAVYCADYVTCTVTNTIFKNNSANVGSFSSRNRYGGAFASNGANSLNTITNCTFINNTAANGIGAIDIRVGNITGCIFEDNYGVDNFPTVYYEANGKGIISYNVFKDTGVQIRLRNNFANVVEQYNWYCTNEPGNVVRKENTNYAPNKFIMMDVYNNGTTVYAGFIKDSNRDDIPNANLLPVREAIFEGNVDKLNVNLTDGLATTVYQEAISESSKINVTIDGQTLTYVLKEGNILSSDVIYVANTSVGNNGTIIIQFSGDNGPVDGTATVLINTTEYTVDFVSGIVLLNVGDKFNAGIYDIYYEYLGGPKYVATFERIKADSKFKIEMVDVEITYTNVFNDITFYVSNKVTPTGTLNVTLGNVSKILTLSNGAAHYNFGLDIAENGTYDLKVLYSGDTNFNPATLQDSFEITKNSNVSLVNFDESRTITYGQGECTYYFDMTDGEVNITSGSINIYEDETYINGYNSYLDYRNEWMVNMWSSRFEAGQHTYTLVYSGDGYHVPTNFTFYVFVAPTISVKTTLNSDTIDVDVTSAASDATGKYTLIVDGEKIANGTLANGKDNITIDKLDGGMHDFKVVYEGNDIYPATNGTASLFIPKTNGQWMNVGNDAQNTGKSNYNRSDNVIALWNATLNGALRSSPIIDSLGNIYLNGGSRVYSFYPNGTLRWTGGVGTAGITIYDDGLIFDSQSGNAMYILNSTTGSHIGGNFWYASSSYAPILGPDGNVYVVTQYGYDNDGGWSGSHWIDIFSKNGQNDYGVGVSDGNFIVQVNGVDYGSPGVRASPTFDKNGYIYVNTAEGFKIVKISTDNVVFSDNTFGATGRAVIDSNNVAYIYGTDGIYAISTSGHLWNTTVTDGAGTTLAIDNDLRTLYAVNSMGVLYKYDLDDNGAESKVYDLGAEGISIIIDDNSTIYVSDKNGNVSAITPEGKLLWSIHLGDSISGQLAMNSLGTIYAVADNTLFALGSSNSLTIETELNNGEGKAIIKAILNSTTEGFVVFTINDDNISDPIAIEEGVAIWETSLPVGNYTIFANFTGNVAYAPCNATSTLNITESAVEFVNVPETLTINYNAMGNFYFDIVSDGVNVTVGSIKGFDGETEITTGMWRYYGNRGWRVWISSGISAGSHTITISYEGQGYYKSCQTTFNLIVVPTLTAEVNIDDDSTSVDVKVSADDATGKFTVTSNNETLANGTIDKGAGHISFDKLAPGTYNLNITYEGDGNYTGSSVIVSIFIPKTSQWANVGNDAQNTGKANATRLDNVVELWNVDLNGDLRSSPIIDSFGNIYLTDGSKVYSFYSNGTLRWTGGVGTAGITIYQDRYIFDPQSGNAMIILNSETGSSMGGNFWYGSSGYAPILGPDGNVYVVTQYGYYDGGMWNGNLWIDIFSADGPNNYGLDVGDANFIVEVNGVGYGSPGVKASPTFDKNGYIYVNTVEGFKIVKIDTNNIVFSDNTFGATGRAVIGGNNIAYIYGAGGIYAINLDGHVWNTTVTGGVGTTLAVDNDLEVIYAVNSKGVLYKYIFDDGTEEAVYDIGEKATSIITDAESNIYVSTSKGNVLAISPEGELLWTINVGSAVSGQLAMDNNGIIYVVADKTLFALGYRNNTDLSVEVKNLTVFDDVDANANININATGNITFIVDGEETTVPIVLDKGFAVLPLGKLSAGIHTVVVIYAGDANYAEAMAETTFEISKADSTTTVDVDSNVDESRVVVKLPDDATGIVYLEVGGTGYFTAIENGEAAFDIKGLEPGKTYLAEITYAGDENYNVLSANATINVPAVPEPVKSNVAASVDGTSVTANLPDDATGYVLVDVNGKGYYAPVKDGKASVDLSDLEAGDYNATVTYTGDDKYASSSTSAKVKVSKKDANINADDVTVDEGQKAVLTVKLANDATGIILAEIDGVTYGALIRNGAATITVPGLAAGNYTANIAYNGDKNYNSAEISNKITVNAVKPSVVISAPDVEKFYGGSERFAVKITEDGKAANNKTVQLTINGNTYTRTTDVNGETSLPLNLNSGKYNVTVKVDDITQNALITIKETVNAKDITKIYRNATQYSATFYDSTGKVLANTMVRFNINGIYYNRTTDANGVAGLNINLNPDKYVLTAINPSTGEQKTSIVTVLPPIVDNHDIVKKYRNGTQYTAKVLKNDGGVAGAGEIVRFNINGIYYDRTTDANGIVQLNINLQPGEYIITAEYNGYMTSNKVTVLSA